MASIDFDVEDYLDEVDDEALIQELKSREKKKGRKLVGTRDHDWMRAGLAADLRSVFYSRNASRFEALLMVLERHEVMA